MMCRIRWRSFRKQTPREPPSCLPSIDMSPASIQRGGLRRVLRGLEAYGHQR